MSTTENVKNADISEKKLPRKVNDEACHTNLNLFAFFFHIQVMHFPE